MFLSAIALALVTGALLGGGLPRLASLQLRWVVVLILALASRLGAQLVGRTDTGIADLAGLLFISGYVFLFAWLWANRRIPGLQVAAVGIGSNALAVIANLGHMPIWDRAYIAAGAPVGALEGNPFHVLITANSIGEFLSRAGILGDVLPIPLPLIRDVVSIGDLLLAAGIFWAVVFAMTQPEGWQEQRALKLGRGLGRRAMTLQTAAAGGASVALAPTAGGLRPEPMIVESSLASTASVAGAGGLAGGTAARRAKAESPYLRLLRNRNFSLLWTGQVVSLFGERLHQLALGFLVLAETGSPLAVGLTFAAASLPNFLLGPLAGALVDRWDRKTAMVGSDVVRAALVVLVPFAIGIHIALVYMLAFLIATVTLVFRPAKHAAVPLVVDEDDLLSANALGTASETAADLVGYPIAGVLVASLGGLIGIAFFIDAATYLLSAVLILAMTLPGTPRAAEAVRPGAIWREMLEGLSFLRRQGELFANTVVSVIAQVAVGAEIAVSIVYAERVLRQDLLGYPENYAILQAAIGLGSLIGGVAVGAFARTLPKGRLSSAGFIAFGVVMVAAGLVVEPLVAIGLFFLLGVANMLFVIPNMTMFQQRTPQGLMGRVVSIRGALVFGVMTLSMAASGFVASVVGPGPAFVVCGAVCAAAGAVGLLFRAVWDAQ